MDRRELDMCVEHVLHIKHCSWDTVYALQQTLCAFVVNVQYQLTIYGIVNKISFSRVFRIVQTSKVAFSYVQYHNL